MPSAHEVARLAGVSQAAVSRAFTPGASIAEATRVKVLDAAKELGYYPNLLARSLTTGDTGIIGVIIGNPRNTFNLAALHALSERVSRADRHLLVFTSHPDMDPDHLLEALLRFRVASLLVMAPSMPGDLAYRCQEKGICVAFFNHRAGMGATFPSVTGANYDGAGVIAEHMLAQGYRRLAVITGDENSSSVREREVGFVARVVSLGLPIPAKVIGGFGRNTMPAARELLSMSPRPDAIFCTHDILAMATIDTARYEFGLEIGREIGIAGFNNIAGAAQMTYNLTTYSQPVDEMIERVTEIILNPQDFPDDCHVIVEGELIARASTQRG